MALPPDIEEAKARMQKAQADLETDIQSGQPYDSKRRNLLLRELEAANSGYVNRMIDLAKQMTAQQSPKK